MEDRIKWISYKEKENLFILFIKKHLEYMQYLNSKDCFSIKEKNYSSTYKLYKSICRFNYY